MRGILITSLCMVLAVFGPASSAHAAVRTAAEAVALGTAANGATVTIEGEAIGEALHAGDGEVWVNVLSGGTALGVVMSEADAARIGEFGRYQKAGATVRVTGVYNVGCDEHGGDVDIHATQVTVVAPGSDRPERPMLWQLGVTVLMAAVAATSAWRYRRARRRHEEG